MYIYISPRVYIYMYINTLVYIVPRWGLLLKTASQWTKHCFVECNTIARHIWVSPKECDAIVLKFNQSCFSQNIFDGDNVTGVFSGVKSKKSTYIFIKTSIIRKVKAASLGDSFFSKYTSWWLNQPHLKDMLVKMGSSSPKRGEH